MRPSGSFATILADEMVCDSMGRMPSMASVRRESHAIRNQESVSHGRKGIYGWRTLPEESGITFRRAPNHPTGDNHDLFLRKRMIRLQGTEAFYRTPGRHGPRQHLLFDVHSPGAHLLVIGQRNRRFFAVARNAALVENSRDVAGKRQVGRNDVVGGSTGHQSGKEGE